MSLILVAQLSLPVKEWLVRSYCCCGVGDSMIGLIVRVGLGLGLGCVVACWAMIDWCVLGLMITPPPGVTAADVPAWPLGAPVPICHVPVEVKLIADQPPAAESKTLSG